MEASRFVALTLNEARYLSDALSRTTEGPESDTIKGAVLAYPHLLIKIGIVCVREADSLEIALTWNELWMIREVTKYSVVIGSEQVGKNLLNKVYDAIQKMGMDSIISDVMKLHEEHNDDYVSDDAGYKNEDDAGNTAIH